MHDTDDSRPATMADAADGFEPGSPAGDIMPLDAFLPDPAAFDESGDPGRVRGFRTGPSLLQSFGDDLRLVVVGASGGIGTALVDFLEEDPAVARVYAFSRSRDLHFGGNVISGHVDLTREQSVERAARAVAQEGSIHGVIVATGSAHAESDHGHDRWLALDAAAMLNAYQVNAIGPALVAKHFLPLMVADGKSVFAALADDALGRIKDSPMPHAYRASKAALAGLIGGLAIDLRSAGRQTVCLGVYPGAVDTPFIDDLRLFRHGEPMFSADFAADRLIRVLDEAGEQDSGLTLAWDGSVVGVAASEASAGPETAAA